MIVVDGFQFPVNLAVTLGTERNEIVHMIRPTGSNREEVVKFEIGSRRSDRSVASLTPVVVPLKNPFPDGFGYGPRAGDAFVVDLCVVDFHPHFARKVLVAHRALEFVLPTDEALAVCECVVSLHIDLACEIVSTARWTFMARHLLAPHRRCYTIHAIEILGVR